MAPSKRAQHFAMVLINSYPDMINRLAPSGPRFIGNMYYCDPHTNIWGLHHNRYIERILCDALTVFEQDFDTDDRYFLESFQGLSSLRAFLTSRLEKRTYTRLDTNLSLFAFTNCVYDATIKNFRPILPEDYVCTTTGWDYDASIVSHHREMVAQFFDILMPVSSEQSTALDFLASLLNGRRIGGFLVISSEQNPNGAGKSTFLEFLQCFFGDYALHDASSVGGKFDSLMTGKRLVTQESYKSRDHSALLKKYTKCSALSRSGAFPLQAGFVVSLNGLDQPRVTAIPGMIMTPFRSRFFSGPVDEGPWNFKDDRTICSLFPSLMSAFANVLITRLQQSPLP